MTREEMRKVLGAGVADAYLDILENLKVAAVDVVHERPVLLGPAKLTQENSKELRPSFLEEGKPRTLTGSQMAGHLKRHADAPEADRYYFAPTGGRTEISLRVGDRDYAGEAWCSTEDTFDRAEGRRVALTRAILTASGGEGTHVHAIGALLALNGIFVDSLLEKVKPPQVVGGTIGEGKTRKGLQGFLDTVNRLTEGEGAVSLADVLRARPATFASLFFGGGAQLLFQHGRSAAGWHQALEDLMPKPHVLLETKALHKLRQAEMLDAKALEGNVSKKERKELLRKAKVLREQATAAAAVACQIKPDPEDEETKSEPAVRNEG